MTNICKALRRNYFNCARTLVLALLALTGCDSLTGSKSLPEPEIDWSEYVSTDLEIVVNPKGGAEFLVTQALKVEGKKVRGGLCQNFPNRIQKPGQPAFEFGIKYTNMVTDHEDLRLGHSESAGGLDACVGYPGVRLKPGIYNWSIMFSTKDRIILGKEKEELLLVVGTSAKIPTKRVAAKVMFERVAFAGLIKTLPIEYVQASAQIIKRKMTIDEFKASHEVATVSRTNTGQANEALQVILNRGLVPGEVAYITVSWPAFMYIDREAAPLAPRESPGLDGKIRT